jgi:bacteriorhodopsin
MAWSESTVYRSAVASLLVQVVTGGVTLAGSTVENERGRQLRAVLVLEFASQLVELTYYLLVVLSFRRIVTWTRYLDWYVSTPVMLLSTALFFRHRRGAPLLPDALEEASLYGVFGLNALMLSFGFAVEVHALPRPFGLVCGTAALAGSFVMLRRQMDATDDLSEGLYWAMFVVWALYGVAAALDDVRKNVAYNALDVVSKNFYGVFLFVYVVSG